MKFKRDLRKLGSLHRETYGMKFADQFREAWHLHELNDLEAYEYVDYHLSSPDISLAVKETFASYNQLCWIQRELNPRAERGALNKWVLYHILTDAGLPTPRVYGLFDPVFGYTTEQKPFRSMDDLRRILDENNLSEFVIKPASGDKGYDVCVFSERRGDTFVTLAGDEMSLEQVFQLMLDTFNKGMPHRRYGIILQDRVHQHELLENVNPHCTNTLRVITLINNSAEIEVLINQLKFGRGKSMVDNTTQGAASSFINENAVLSKLTHVDRERMIRYEKHPDTNAPAAGLTLPFFKEALQLARDGQRCLPQLRSIGWDIAITNDGPTILEGNAWYGWHPQPRGRIGIITPSLREILDNDIMPKYRGNQAGSRRA
jgi:hypothetical protein